MSIPDRWLNYKPIGVQIKGTPFIAFKVPLSADINKRVENEDVRLEIPHLIEKIPNLGMVIDLTFTTKYYSPNVFRNAGIKHVKLMIPGKQVPQAMHTKQFSEYVKSFIDDEDNKDKLIGVHCTHGVNRTGYFICHHMVTSLKIHPDEALQKFEEARGHPLERQNYRDALISLASISESIEDNNFNPNMVRQGNYGYSSKDSISPPRYRHGASPYQRPRFSRSPEASWRRGSRPPPFRSRRDSKSPPFRGRRNSKSRSPPLRRRRNSKSRSPSLRGRRGTGSRSPPYRNRNNGRYNNRYGGRNNRYTHNDAYRRNDRRSPPPFNGNGSSTRDPLPSHDFGARYSVMAELYAEPNSPPRSRYSWRKPS